MYIKLKKDDRLSKARRNSGRIDNILRFFDNNPGEHFSVKQVFQALYDKNEKVSESTLYRLMKLLCDEKLLQKKHMPGGIYVFEKTGGMKHDHIFCTKCNSTFPLYERRIDTLFGKLADEYNARIEDRDVVIYVSCMGDLCPRVN